MPPAPVKYGPGSELFGNKGGALITPHDSTDIAVPPKAIRVGTAGDVVVLAQEDDEGTWTAIPNMQAGELIPFRVRRILATVAADGYTTTASDFTPIRD